MTLDLKKLRELEQAATPGPWSFDDGESGGCAAVVCESGLIADCYDGLREEKDAEFIAEARNALPELLAAAEEVVEIRGVEKELSRRTDEIVRLTQDRDRVVALLKRCDEWAQGLPERYRSELIELDVADYFEGVPEKQPQIRKGTLMSLCKCGGVRPAGES